MWSAATSTQNCRVLSIRNFIVESTHHEQRHRSKLEKSQARKELKERQSPEAEGARSEELTLSRSEALPIGRPFECWARALDSIAHAMLVASLLN
jgi:hypothetical protein